MAAPLTARILPRDEYVRWDEFVRSAPSGSVYSTSAYLDLLCEATGATFRVLAAERAGAFVGGVALFERRAAWGSYVATRRLLYYNGLVLAHHPSTYPSEQTSRALQTMGALEAALRPLRHARLRLKCTPAVADVRPFLEAGWSAVPTYTYVVPLTDLAAAWRRVEQNLRRLVDRCTREGLRLAEDGDFDAFHRWHLATHARKGAPLYLEERPFRRFVERLRESGLGRLYHARLPSGESVASLLVLCGPHPVAHTVCAGTAPDHVRSGASAFLRWRAIEDLAARGHVANDLTDAALGPVTHFKSQFGGDLRLSLQLARPDRALCRVAGALGAGRRAVGSLASRVLRRGGRAEEEA